MRFAAVFLLLFIFGAQNVSTRNIPESNQDVILYDESNPSMSKVQHRGSKYPLLPRSYSRHRRHDYITEAVAQDNQNLLMNIEADIKRNELCRTGEYRKAERGHYTFKGHVKCADRNGGYYRPLETAVVKLMEFDYVMGDYDDVIAASPIKPNGEYEVSGDAIDYIYKHELPNVELYLLFENVCFYGDSYFSGCPDLVAEENYYGMHRGFNNYILRNGAAIHDDSGFNNS